MQSYQSMKQIMYKIQYQYVANSIVSSGKRAGKLTLTQQLESNGCLFCPVATDGLVLHHQAISINSAD